jgi:hypothetical protein
MRTSGASNEPFLVYRRTALLSMIEQTPSEGENK